MAGSVRAFRAQALRSLSLAAMVGAAMGCAPTTDGQLTYRARADLDAPLNADTGWAGPTGEAVTIAADQPFRLRIEAGAGEADAGLHLQARRNGGEWQNLDAQAFPYPKLELELDFAEYAPGSALQGWLVRAGAADGLAIAQDGPDSVLRAQGGAAGLTATYAAPWPLPEFSYAARFRLPEGASEGAREGFALVFEHVDADNHGLVRVHPDRGITLVRISDGEEIVLARESVAIARGSWHEVEVKFEEGRIELGFDDRDLLAMPLSGIDGETGLAIPAGAEVDISRLTIEGVPSTPGVSIIATQAYDHGAATEDLLAGSSDPFAPGFGLSLRNRTPTWGGAEAHGEFEWPLVIRRFADGAALNESGDRFEFRMAGGQAANSAVAQLTLTVPPGHLGGTFVETPGRIGPWQAQNGDLYFIMEPTETDNKFMMVKSEDGGRSWREIDGRNRPQTGDLESVSGQMVEGRIHIVHQVTGSVRYHVFRTSDHPTDPDSWEIRDELAASEEAIAQTATMAVRSDQSVVAIFLADRLYYAIRSAEGSWGAPRVLDPGAEFINAGPQAVAGRGDVVHLAYFSDDGMIWYRRLLPGGTLTDRQKLARGAGTSRAEYGAVLPLAYDAETDSVTIAYRLADGSLWERQVKGGSAPGPAVRISDRAVIADAVDSQQPAADLVADGGSLFALFVDEDTRSIFSTRRLGDRWEKPVLQVDGIAGSWVRGSIIRRPDGRSVYGYVYDAGSQGGAGFNRYRELSLDAE
ncbi:MAG: hypothetical protein KKE77_05810 [Alphaproteobacteria bacterium]|nr:hypothetical protein [Alphaproteobacteria bacterium]